MRSSAIKSDPGYATFQPGASITVDGVPVRDCFTADEELGEAWCYVRNAAGVFEKDSTGRKIHQVCHRGKVVIIPVSSLPSSASNPKP